LSPSPSAEADALVSLVASHTQLARILKQFGIEIGPDVLAVWADRQTHAEQPLPAAALDELARWAAARMADLE
jgi:hypothetical protein